MRIKNDAERRFYEIEATQGQWDVRRLQRQYGSSLYERLALSREKDAVMKLASEGQTIEKPQDLLKNPLSLEFLGMEEKPQYSESDLESAIISKLQQFLLELGKGFLYEARQKRFTFNEKHYKVDLVTYNRLLKCYVLIDLKTDVLEHQDLGQMQMYVHYFDRHVKRDGENPTIGILLCKEKDDAIVELTLPEGENIFASEYSLYLPDKTLLQRKLAEWIQEFEDEKALGELAAGGDAE
jgi:predicted nuclease of restriction endonuclease-like (RecB) superfamily